MASARVLFVCLHGSAKSIIAQEHLARVKGRITAAVQDGDLPRKCVLERAGANQVAGELGMQVGQKRGTGIYRREVQGEQCQRANDDRKLEPGRVWHIAPGGCGVFSGAV